MHNLIERLSEEELKDLNRLYLRYLDEKVQIELDRLFEERGWDDSRIEEWRNGHYRS